MGTGRCISVGNLALQALGNRPAGVGLLPADARTRTRPRADPAPDAFVTRSGSRLTLAGRPYHFLGFNAYQVAAGRGEWAGGVRGGGGHDEGRGGQVGPARGGEGRTRQEGRSGEGDGPHMQTEYAGCKAGVECLTL